MQNQSEANYESMKHLSEFIAYRWDRFAPGFHRNRKLHSYSPAEQPNDSNRARYGTNRLILQITSNNEQSCQAGTLHM